MSLLSRFWSRDHLARKAAADLLGAIFLIEDDVIRKVSARILEQANALDKESIRKGYEAQAAERKAFAADPNARRRLADESLVVRDGVAVIGLKGVMLKEVPSAFSLFGEPAVSTNFVRLQLDIANQRQDVRSILILADTPGGAVDGTDALGTDVYNSKKPVHVYAGDLAASAGVWVSSQASRFTAGSTAAIGSIGVYTIIDDTSKLFEMNGIKVHKVSTGGVKGALEDGLEISPEALADVQRRIDTIGAMFVDAVAKGREMDRSKIEKLKTGQVWFGEEARVRGLIDAVETEAEAFEAARKAAEPSQTRVVVDDPLEEDPFEEGAKAEENSMKLAEIYAKLAKGEKLTEAEQTFLREKTGEPEPTPPASNKATPAPIVRVDVDTSKDAKIAALEKKLEELETSQKRADYLKQAAAYKYVPGLSIAEIADELAAADIRGPEAGAKKRQHFAAVHEMIQASKAFDVLGSSRSGDDSPMGQLQALARQIRAKDPKKSELEALTDAGELRPDLYDAAQFEATPLPE